MKICWTVRLNHNLVCEIQIVHFLHILKPFKRYFSMKKILLWIFTLVQYIKKIILNTLFLVSTLIVTRMVPVRYHSIRSSHYQDIRMRRMGTAQYKISGVVINNAMLWLWWLFYCSIMNVSGRLESVENVLFLYSWGLWHEIYLTILTAFIDLLQTSDLNVKHFLTFRWELTKLDELLFPTFFF